MRESYITQYPLMRPRPLTSRHSSRAAEPHAAQLACGGYCRRLHAAQFWTIRRRSLHASQNGLLTSSGTGIGLGITHSAAPPAELPPLLNVARESIRAIVHWSALLAHAISQSAAFHAGVEALP